ncbi:hypothetical protein ES705_39126 [subsurface metagenome]
MAVKCGIGCPFFKAGSYNPGDIGILGHPRNFADHILPILPAIAGDLQVTVICACIDETFFKRGFRNCCDIAVIGNAVVSGKRVFVWKHSHKRKLFSILLSCQINRGFPCLSSILGFKEFVSAVIDCFGIMGGYQNRRIPVKPVTLFLIIRSRPYGLVFSCPHVKPV